MSFWKAVLAAFVGSVLAGVFLLAYRVSQETQKNLPESLADVPAEAKRVYVDVKAMATDAVRRVHGPASEAEAEMGDWPETGYVMGGSVDS
jgi:hypothetical protein